MSEEQVIEEKQITYEREDGSRYRRTVGYVQCPLCFGDNPGCPLCEGTGKMKTETVEELDCDN